MTLPCGGETYSPLINSQITSRHVNNTNTNLVTILKVCQDPVVGACFGLHPRHHHSALLRAHHELAEHGDDDGDGDGDGDDDEEEAVLKRELCTLDAFMVIYLDCGSKL